MIYSVTNQFCANVYRLIKNEDVTEDEFDSLEEHFLAPEFYDGISLLHRGTCVVNGDTPRTAVARAVMEILIKREYLPGLRLMNAQRNHVVAYLSLRDLAEAVVPLRDEDSLEWCYQFAMSWYILLQPVRTGKVVRR